MPLPKVRVVTPTDPGTSSITAFEDELFNHFGWQKNVSVDYKVYTAVDDYNKLQAKAQDAVNDAPQVIVAAGSAAAGYLQLQTAGNPTIPIIQAAGGEVPPNPQGNLTGFTINALQIARHHLKKLSASTNTITVLYDPTNPVSLRIYGNLTPPAGKTKQPLAINTAGGFGAQPHMDGFMIIPSAMYYHNASAIVTMVDGNANAIYYPEREFKNLHATRTNVRVHGHHIPATFRLTAGYVNSILSGTMDVTTLPLFQGAVEDSD
jgi:hypothetical protein